jgi:glutamate synthase domain-containing protein 1
MVVKEDTCICIIISVNRTTRMVPCYTCLNQSFPVDTADLAQSNTPDRPDIAHLLYSIINQQHTCIQSNIHEANKEIQLEQYTNSSKTVIKVYKTLLHVSTITQTQISPNSELKRESYEFSKISYR